MTPQPPLEIATINAVLDSLLGHDPPPLVVALNEGGLFVLSLTGSKFARLPGA